MSTCMLKEYTNSPVHLSGSQCFPASKFKTVDRKSILKQHENANHLSNSPASTGDSRPSFCF